MSRMALVSSIPGACVVSGAERGVIWSEVSPAPEPLLAPPDRHEWQTLWTSEAAKYGGLGQRAMLHERGWTLFAEETVAFRAAATFRSKRSRIACRVVNRGDW